MNNLSKRVKSLLRLSLLLIALYSVLYTSYSHAQDKIVAIVNNEIITQKDLNDFINFMRMQLAQELKGKDLESKIQSIKVDLLNKLIEDRLILQKARKSNIKVDEAMVKIRVDETKKRYPSEEAFQRAISSQGLVQADIEARIREQILTRNIIEMEIRNKVSVKPAEVTEFYEKNKEKFKVPQAREFESISISDEELAKGIYEKLKKGIDLDSVAKENSLLINKLKVYAGGELRKDIEEVVFKLKEGGLSPPIKIEQTYYIFRLDRIAPPRIRSLSEVQEKISSYLFDMKAQEALLEWLDELKKQAYIKIFSS